MVAEIFSGWRRGSRGFGEGFSDEAGRKCSAGRRIGSGRLLLNTKASQEAACSRAPDATVPDQEPESHDAGVSRFGENGSHPAAADAAEGYAGQVDSPGSSGNAGIGSHLARADFSDEPEVVL